MAKRSVFRRAALASGLITREQLDEAEADLRSASLLPGSVEAKVDDERLASHMIELGWLTSYQVDQLKAGRTKLSLGPYLITEWIGQGGMGQVFKAVHKMMGRECAVKVLPSQKATPETVSNFAREVRTQAQMDHPFLVRAYDAGHDGNVHYLVTEYVPGTDLRRLVRTRGPLTMQQAAKVIMQAALGLDYAHSRGLIHRDVKPGNILVTPEGDAKVSDLGLAGFVDEGDLDPRSNKVVGTADYLSPEQIRTPRDITCVSDIYSLGCTLYYAVCGKVPFPGGTTREKARRHCEETPWHPRRFNPEISEEFVEIIAEMMEKDPAARISSAAEVAARLEPWAAEASPIPSQQLSKSPWTAPPPPEEDDGPESAPGEGGDVDSRSLESPSQISQLTDSVSGSRQDTRTARRTRSSHAPPLNLSDSEPAAVVPLEDDDDDDDDDNGDVSWPVGVAVAVALAIAVPSSMLLGAALTFLLLKLLS